MRRTILIAMVSLGCRSKGSTETGTILTDTGEPCTPVVWYLDSDGDGYGGNTDYIEACDAPGGYIEEPGDCDDTDSTIHPGAEEICDGIDNNCDGLVDIVERGEDNCTLDETAIVLTGESVNDLAGYVVAGVGDVDQDGYDDVLIGAPNNDAGGTDAGSSYLVRGPITTSRNLSTAQWRFTGMADNDGSGISLDGGEDFDGDGIPDMVIGAHWESSVAYQAGAAYLFTSLPAKGDVPLDEADAILLGEAEDDWAGEFVSMIDDASGDGLADLLITADRSDINGTESGVVYLISGPISGEHSLEDAQVRMMGTAEGDRAGSGSAGLGDLDGDGLCDLGIGAWAMESATGQVFVVYGGSVSGDLDLSDADAWFTGEAEGDSAGRLIRGVGDISGDGLDDLLIGAPYHSDGGKEAGAVYAIFSAPDGEISLSEADVKLLGEHVGDTLGGHGAAGVGDLDGDGEGDVVIGVNNDDEGGKNAGAVYMVLSPMEDGVVSLIGDVAMAKFLGESANEEAGVSVDGAGDTNADGMSDVLIGGPETFGEDEGVAYLILGSF